MIRNITIEELKFTNVKVIQSSVSLSSWKCDQSLNDDLIFVLPLCRDLRNPNKFFFHEE